MWVSEQAAFNPFAFLFSWEKSHLRALAQITRQSDLHLQRATE